MSLVLILISLATITGVIGTIIYRIDDAGYTRAQSDRTAKDKKVWRKRNQAADKAAEKKEKKMSKSKRLVEILKTEKDPERRKETKKQTADSAFDSIGF